MHGPLAQASKSIRKQVDSVRQAFNDFRDTITTGADDTEELDESLATFNDAIENLRMQFDRHLELHNRRLVEQAILSEIENKDPTR